MDPLITRIINNQWGGTLIMRFLVTLAILLTLFALILAFRPQIDEFLAGYDLQRQQQKSQTATTPVQQSQRGPLFGDMAMSADGTSALQSPTPAANPQRVQPQVPQPVNQPRILRSARDKFFQFAKDNDCRIIFYQEPAIGNVIVTLETRDKNNVYGFMDAVEKGVRMLDIENVKNGYQSLIAPDGSRIIRSSLKIKYSPE